jgi:hypothetical protein
MEYRCSACSRIVHLVPHGRGRYARPVEPPGPAPAEEDLRPPWFEATPRPAAQEEPSPRPPDPDPPPSQERAATPPPADRPSLAEAHELLGVPPGADAPTLERAFRERSLTCHPDKAAHLDEDIQRLAEAKFLRLRAAYDLLCEGRDPD